MYKKRPYGARKSTYNRSSRGTRSQAQGSQTYNRRNSSNRNTGRSKRGGFNIKSWSVSELVRFINEVNNARPTQIDNQVETAKATLTSFDSFDISFHLKKNIKYKNYESPTPIQAEAIPVIQKGYDFIGSANTGSGKTAAFLIPLIDKVSKAQTYEKVLIITPTRELATQIYDEFRGFSNSMGIYAATCIGGVSIYPQKSQLRRNPSFVIGTPGRLKDLIKQGVLDLSSFNNVVLDETDTMVDIGFLEEIKYFISLLPKKRQSLFFSATMSPKVREILNMFVTDAVIVNVKKQEASLNIEQQVVYVEHNQNKIDVLDNLLSQKGFDKVLIFGRTKWGVQKLSEELSTRGYKANAIHGDKRQNQRQAILNQFKKAEIKVLLATDVASRGLDIKDVSHVINYDMPENRDDYVHRIGRTGRADKRGVALTFVE